MAPYKLPEKWGSKEIWLRSLFIRSGIIWLFREEFDELELGLLKSLDSILVEAYRIADREAARFDTQERAFLNALELLKREIDHRISVLGDENGELERFKKIVEEASVCDPLRKMFRLLARNARTVYHSNSCREALLEANWLINHPYGEVRPGDYRDAYHVNAQTRVSSKAATVELQVHLDRFDVVSMLAVPALFTHELVCHAHAQEDQNNNHSLWAEGVMDWVAAYFFEAWAPGVGLPYGLTKIHGRQLWDDRMTPWRYAGRLAADALVEWLVKDRSVRRTSVAQAVTTKFALQVNLADAPLLAKDMLASRLANIRRDVALQDAVRTWRHDGIPVTGLLA